MDGLSGDRRRSVSEKPERVPAVPPMNKQVTEVASEYQVQHPWVMAVVYHQFACQICAPLPPQSLDWLFERDEKLVGERSNKLLELRRIIVVDVFAANPSAPRTCPIHYRTQLSMTSTS
ncbi:hypothetical protein FRC03_005662 [Tulasnella sp. 419]|nr:hypothetical protein FRC03_005662 [Tulasnella sp. 419]